MSAGALALRTFSADQALIGLALASIYLIPPLGGSDFAIRPIYLFYGLIPFLAGKNLAFDYLRYYFLFLLSALISILFGSAVLNVHTGIPDYLEIVRLILPLPAFLIGHLLFTEYRARFNALILRLSLVIALITAFQHFKLMGGFFSKLYSADSQLPAALGLETEYMRVVGVSGNPNDAGMLFFFLQLLFMSTLLKKVSAGMILGWGCSTICLAMTQSKTAYAAFAFSIFFIFIINQHYRFLLIAAAVLSLCWVLFAHDAAYVNNFYTAVHDDGLFGANVFAVRFENALVAYDIWRASPLLGWGVAKEIHPSVVDVEYFLLLRRYGLIGVACLAAFLLATGARALRHIASSDANIAICANFLCVVSPAILIFMTSNNVFSAYYNQFFFFMMLGVFAEALQTSRADTRLK